MSWRSSDSGSGAVIVYSLFGGMPTVTCGRISFTCAHFSGKRSNHTCFCRTSKSVTALARSSTRLPSMPAECLTRPHSFCWHAFSYKPLSRVRTVTTLPSSSIPSDVEVPFVAIFRFHLLGIVHQLFVSTSGLVIIGMIFCLFSPRNTSRFHFVCFYEMVKIKELVRNCPIWQERIKSQNN